MVLRVLRVPNSGRPAAPVSSWYLGLTISSSLDELNNDNTLYYESLIEIRKENKISFGDSQLEKAYNDYMDNLIKKAKENSNSSSNE